MSSFAATGADSDQRSSAAACGLPARSMAWECALRNWAFEHGWIGRVQAAVPVVSVGNLTLGGTGKTPCVEYVARFIREQERRRHLSRGYAPSTASTTKPWSWKKTAGRAAPPGTGSRAAWRTSRSRSSRVKCWCSTTAFSIGGCGDLDIVLLDATCPWGYGRCFRAACCATAAAWSRAHVILLTRLIKRPADSVDRLRQEATRWAFEAPVARKHPPAGDVGERLAGNGALEAARSRPVAGFCGLGNPEAFRRTLAGLGLDVSAWRTFPIITATHARRR